MTHPIHVIGLRGGWQTTCDTAIKNADLLVGGKRQLSLFPEFPGETLPITSNIPQVIETIKFAQSSGKRVAVLASGDPLCFGIGSTLRRYFDADELAIVPAVSAFQLAFSALGEPWQDASLVTAHGRDKQKVLVTVMTSGLSAVLTDTTNTPTQLATDLLKLGLDPKTQCAVCEQLGSVNEAIHRLSLSAVSQQDFHPLNVFVIWNGAPRRPQPAGLPDDAFVTERQQITKREVRLAVLAELGLQAGETMWDIGSGSGSVAIEAARMQPTAQVFACEKDATMAAHWRTNVQTHGAFNAQLTDSHAPDGLADWPDPDVVFVGGSGGKLAEIVAVSKERLGKNGRLISTFATLENLNIARELLPDAYVYQIQINRFEPIATMTRLSAQNPVFVLKWEKRK